MSTPNQVAPPTPSQIASQAAPQTQTRPGGQGLIRLQNGDDVRMEPLENVVALAQKNLRVDAELQKIATMREEMAGRERELTARRAEIENKVRFADTVTEGLAQRPDETVEWFKRQARMANGRPLAGDGAAGTEPNSEVAEATNGTHRQDPTVLAALRETQTELQRLKAESSADRFMRESSEALNGYTLFSDPANPVSVEARAQAAEMMAIARHADPRASVSELASRAHGRMQRLLTGSTQQVFNERVTTAAAVPAVSTQGTTPGLSDNGAPKPTLENLRNGSLRNFFQEGLRRALPSR